MSVSAVNVLSPMDLRSSDSAVTRTSARAAASTTSSSTGGATTGLGLTGTSTGTTFLNLLVKELQNQDPSAPMDSTAMVGQMISLNQLDQLIGINQDLGGSTTASGTITSSTSSAATNGHAGSSSALMEARTSLLNGDTDTPTAQSAMIAASDPSSTLQLSNLNIYGAK